MALRLNLSITQRCSLVAAGLYAHFCCIGRVLRCPGASLSNCETFLLLGKRYGQISAHLYARSNENGRERHLDDLGLVE